jgi:hypothetical protein
MKSAVQFKSPAFISTTKKYKFMKNNTQIPDHNIQKKSSLSRRGFMTGATFIGAGLALGPLSWISTSARSEERNADKDNSAATNEFIEGLAELMAHSTRTPVLKKYSSRQWMA